jgi:hypothetical protein
VHLGRRHAPHATQPDQKLNRRRGRLDKIGRVADHRRDGVPRLEGVMTEASQYRRHAAECRDIAATLDGPHREQLVAMAEAWERLAQEEAATARKPPPLVADPDDAKGG